MRRGKDVLNPEGFNQRRGRSHFVPASIWCSLISKNWMLKSVFGIVYRAVQLPFVMHEYAHCLVAGSSISLPCKAEGNNYPL